MAKMQSRTRTSISSTMSKFGIRVPVTDEQRAEARRFHLAAHLVLWGLDARTAEALTNEIIKVVDS